MTFTDIIRRGFVNAGGTFIYVSLVSWFIFNAEKVFGSDNGKNFIIPIFMLMLFVVSACVTGFLVLGKPILLYFEGSKKEGIKLLITTLAWMILFLVIIILALLLR